VAGAFAVDMARHTPELAAELGKALGEGNTELAAELSTTAALNTYFTARTAQHAIGRPRSDLAKALGKALQEQLKRPEWNEALERIAEQEAVAGAEPRAAIFQATAAPLVRVPFERLPEPVPRGTVFAGETITGPDVQKGTDLPAAQARKGARSQATTEKKLLKQQEAQRKDFEQTAFKPNAPGKPEAEAIRTNELLIGDEFELAGVKVKVKDLVFDPDTTELAYVVLEDGRRFEAQTVSGDQVIYPDKGTLKQKEPSTEFVPQTEAPAVLVPKLRPMEKGTAELFQGEDQPFNLAGEMATDFERIAAKKAKAEQLQQEAAAAAAKQQTGFSGAGFASRDPFREGAAGAVANLSSEARAAIGSSPVQILGQDQRFGGLDQVRPLNFPEVLRLSRHLTQTIPKLKRYSKALGIFYPIEGGRVGLHPKLFELANLEQLQATLAHEVGHLADYLPDRTMDRGNILGRIASLKEFLKQTLPIDPKQPLDTILSKADRVRIRRKAENQVGGRPPKDEQADLAAWQEEVRRVYRELIEDEIAARKLVEHSEIREELRQLSEYWKPIPEGATEGYLDYRYSGVELYADAFSVLFNSPGLLKQRAPTFWETFFNYLDRKPDVKKAFLDLQTLLHQGPDAVARARISETREGYMKAEAAFIEKLREQQARRNNWKGFWTALKQEFVDKGEALTRAVNQVKASGKDVPAWADPRLAWEQSLFSENSNFRDVRRIFEEIIKPIEAAGIDKDTLGLVLQYQRQAGNRQAQARYLDLKGKAERTEGETAELTELEAQVGTRAQIPSPQGLQPQFAEQTLNQFLAELGPEKARLVTAAADRFRQIFYKRFLEGARWGIFSKRSADIAEANKDSYAAFRGLAHIDTYVTPVVRKAYGTLGEVENPFITTLLKLTSLNQLIEVQKAKFKARDFMQANGLPGFEAAQEYWDGQRWQFRKKPAEGLARLEMLEDGRLKAYDVDPYIAEAFEKLTPTDVSRVTFVADWIFRKGLYPIFIKYNPGFQYVFNPYRDFKRTARNLGALHGVGRLELIREYVKSWKTAKSWARGEPDALTNKMMEAGAIGTPIDSFSRLDRTDALGEIMRRYRLLPDVNGGPARQVFESITKPAMAVLKHIEQAGVIREGLPKVATYRALVKTRGVDPAAAAMVVRNYVGTPNFRIKGKFGNMANVIVPFANIFIQGYRSDLRLARSPTTAAGWWFRWMLHDGSKAVIIGMASAGVLGSALKELYDGVSEYDKSNYTTVPVGWVAGGDHGRKVVYLRFPRDEVSRFLSAGVYKLTRLLAGDKEARRVPSEMFAIGTGMVPSPTPVLTVADAWNDYLGGQNPVDPWRNRPVIPPTEFEAGGWNSLKPMLVFTADKAGVLNFIGYNPRAQTTTEISLAAIPGLNRVLKISDQGYRERQFESLDDERRTSAIMRLEYSAEVRKLIHEFYALQRIAEKRTELQQERYASLSAWMTGFRRYDEAIRVEIQESRKDAAISLRQEFEAMTNRDLNDYLKEK
jgi:hypothetical protein